MEDVELLEELIKAIVTESKKVKVTRKVDEMGVLLGIESAKEDRKIIIGKKGQTIDLFRKIFFLVGIKNQARYSIKVIEDERGR
jgi:predicted RNA-binding protein YlqC (UPF0109 family)